ncbi:MAG TPA: chorismate mutase [Solirubrobacterales bacterium]
MTDERLYAVRAAVQAERNDSDSILSATEDIVRELMGRNSLEPAAMVSCIFTVTDDLDAEFPAVAARRLGLARVPLLCTREIPVPGAMERVIRALVHFYAPAGHVPRHAYLGAARALRSDLESAQ